MTPIAPSSARFIALACSIFALLGATAFSQTATTDPVGFITLKIEEPAAAFNGPAAAEASRLSFLGLGMTRPVDYQGNAEGVNPAAKTLTDNDANWTAGQFDGASGEHYVEITSGPRTGVTLDIASTVQNTITTVQAIPADVAAGVTFKIRKHWTIASVFGPNNEAGLAGGGPSDADQILIYDAGQAKYDRYYYKQGGIGTNGWRNIDTGDDATNAKVYPDDGILIKKQQPGSPNVVLTGAVKMGATSIPVSAGLNIIGNVYAAPMTLASSQLYTGDAATGIAGGGPSDADQVLIHDGTQYRRYYYKVGGLGGGTGWRDVDTGDDAAAVQIPVGKSILIRRNTGSGFNWVAPQHPANLQ